MTTENIPISRSANSVADPSKVLINSPLTDSIERRNYNLQTGVTEYQLWPFSTIERVHGKNEYRARVMIQHKVTKNIVSFNSMHENYADAESAIDLVSDSLSGIGERRVYNVFGETIETHTSDIGTGAPIQVAEVRALIWSLQQVAAS
jgi:hypothetical protein